MRFHPKYTTRAKGLYYHIPLPSSMFDPLTPKIS